MSAVSTNTRSTTSKVRKTPTLAQVQVLNGDAPVEPYDERFLVNVGTQKRAHDRIKEIVKVSERLLADPLVGLNKITTALIAEGVGMSIGSFYRYFEDIVALLDYIWPERVVTFTRKKGSS